MEPTYKHLETLSFQNESERLEILKRGLDLFKEKKISEEAIELGKEYRHQIAQQIGPKVSVRYISKKIGFGAFAEKDIPKGEYVGEYVGVVRENIKVYFAPLNDYLYEYPVPDSIGRSYCIDASSGNFTRFINHSEKPNLKPKYAFLDGFYHVIFISLKNIKKESQLLYNYGQNYWNLRGKPKSFH